MLGRKQTAKVVGGNSSFLMDETDAIAEIGNATVKANDLTVEGKAGHLGVGINAAGSKAGKLSFNGAFSHTTTDTEARAQIDAASGITLSGKLDLDADETVSLVKFAGAASRSNSTSAGFSSVSFQTDRKVRLK